jgi:hypothetical protein
MVLVRAIFSFSVNLKRKALLNWRDEVELLKANDLFPSPPPSWIIRPTPFIFLLLRCRFRPDPDSLITTPTLWRRLFAQARREKLHWALLQMGGYRLRLYFEVWKGFACELAGMEARLGGLLRRVMVSHLRNAWDAWCNVMDWKAWLDGCNNLALRHFSRQMGITPPSTSARLICLAHRIFLLSPCSSASVGRRGSAAEKPEAERGEPK